MTGRDLIYSDGTTDMLGYFTTDDEATGPRPGVLMIHGGFGLIPQIMDNADRLAAAGYAVLAADLWGGRHCPPTPSEFMKLIAGLTEDPTTWMARLDAACDALTSQPDVAIGAVAAAGYCFGGSSVLEYARRGRELAAVISLHGGLGDVGLDWTSCHASTTVLILTGADDPMATPAALTDLQAAMTTSTVDWETHVFSQTDHAYTFPDSANYNGRSDRRSQLAMTTRLGEALRSDG